MKKMKRLLGFILAMIMVIAMAVPVMATGNGETPTQNDTNVGTEITGNQTITFKHIKKGHTFAAYQIFAGNLTDKGYMSNITWGTGISSGEQLIAALKLDETEIFNSDKTLSVIIKDQFASVNNASDVADVIKNWSSNGERLDYLAEFIGGNGTKTGYLVSSESLNVKKSDCAENADEQGYYTYTIAGLAPGYYLIKDITTDQLQGEDYNTKYLISLVTSTDIKTKGHYSTITIGVGNTLNGTYTEYISENLNKDFYYKWEVALDDNLNWYDKYQLNITGTMDSGISFKQFEEIYIEESGGDRVYIFQRDASNNEVWKEDLDVSKRPEIKHNTNVVTFKDADIKDLYSGLAGDDKLIVKFSATLNKNAVSGDGSNKCVVSMVYSNAPSNNKVGTSVTDTAYVFTYKLNVNKVCADNQALTLPGAKFLLYHYHGETKVYAKEDSVVKGAIVEWVLDPNDATPFITDANGKFTNDIKGLKEATKFYLNEVDPPVGYNLMFTDVAVTINPEYASTNNAITLTGLKYSVDGNSGTVTDTNDIAAGLVKVTVTNDKGTTLPSTGGIGTTIFYVAGGALAFAAVVLLVTKRRMEK